MAKTVTTILCSGVALGVYIPAMLLNYQLRKQDIPTEVIVLESLIISDKKDKINENKKAFHKSFDVALTGQKMARDIRPSLEKDRLESLFNKWKKEERRKFIIFSGFWVPIIEDYIAITGFSNINIDLCHMDADISASWKKYQHLCEKYNNIWLFSYEKKSLFYEIAITDQPVIPYTERYERYVIHGGGWGMGTYQSKIPELEARGIPLDIVIYDLLEADTRKPENRYFLVDPCWSPWHVNDKGEHEFPHFGEVGVNETVNFKWKEEYHELFDIIRYSKAIISKPGGATLMDSLASATPVITLDPFGNYEQKNGQLWNDLGYGIPYDTWRAMDYSADILEQLHKNLLNARNSLVDYGRSYAAKNRC